MSDLDIAALRKHLAWFDGPNRSQHCQAVYHLNTNAVANARALLDAAEQLQAVTAERDQLRADLRSQFTAAFAKLRETLGSDIGTGGGLVEILDGIDQLRAQRDTLMAAASAICRDDHDGHYDLGAHGLRTLRAAVRNCKETQ